MSVLLKILTNGVAYAVSTSCMVTQRVAIFSIILASPSTFRHCSATDSSASGGHLVNQSIVQQFTSDGNMRQRRLYAMNKSMFV